jgi:hypothetical protein
MYQILRVEKLRKISNVASSGSHIFRERVTKNADPERTPLNHGEGARSSAELVEAVNARLKTVPKPKPSNGKTSQVENVVCLEYLIGASPEFFKLKTDAEREQYFKDGLDFIKVRHGAENVVCSDIQLDEKTPHMSVFVVPIVKVEGVGTRIRNVKAAGGGRKDIEVPNKSTVRLSAKHFCDGTLSDLQTDFHQSVSEKYGLKRGEKGSTADHVRLQKWYAELEPKIQAAKVVIEEAIQVDSTLKKRAVEVQLKEDSQVATRAKMAAVMVELKTKDVLLNEKELLLSKRESVLKQAEAWLQSQKEIIVAAFEHLPSAVQEKLSELFKPKKAPEVVKTINPTPNPENTPKTPKTGLLDVLKSPVNTGNHQKPR